MTSNFFYFFVQVEEWVLDNAKRFDGHPDFIQGPTERTTKLWKHCSELLKEEIKKGVLDCDTKTPSMILSHQPGVIHKDIPEFILGLQTDAPLKRAIKPFGGVSLVKQAAEAYGYTLDPLVEEIFTKYRKTHNQGVFDVYSAETRLARRVGIITGLPDNYGRGRYASIFFLFVFSLIRFFFLLLFPYFVSVFPFVFAWWVSSSVCLTTTVVAGMLSFSTFHLPFSLFLFLLCPFLHFWLLS